MRLTLLVFLLALSTFASVLSVQAWQERSFVSHDLPFSHNSANGFGINSQPISVPKHSITDTSFYFHAGGQPYEKRHELNNQQVFEQSASSHNVYEPEPHSVEFHNSNSYFHDGPNYDARSSQVSQFYRNFAGSGSVSRTVVDRESNAPHVDIGNGNFLITGDIITLQLFNSMYLKRYYPFPSTGYSGVLAYESHVDAFSKFSVETIDSQHIYLRAENGQYLKRCCCWHGMSVILMYTNKSDPYSKFKVVPANDGKVRLQADNDEYLKPFNGWNSMNVLAVSDVQDEYGLFGIQFVDRPNYKNVVQVNSNLALYDGDVISIKLDNSMYVKRFYPFPSHGFSGALAYQTFIDPFSKFSVQIIDSQHIYLKADNGQYLKRYCCWNHMNVVAIYLDHPDQFSKFKVIPAENGKARLQAENGHYLKRFYGWNGKNVLAVLNVQDEFGLFDIKKL